ncbi:hypothetical protein [Nocardia sp. NPDC052316]|uniref:hypothetical protein n=1 Tax=Nocardia sp. NPDC052316 TaxID=3364329 RepID=UPI0037CA65F2
MTTPDNRKAEPNSSAPSLRRRDALTLPALLLPVLAGLSAPDATAGPLDPGGLFGPPADPVVPGRSPGWGTTIVDIAEGGWRPPPGAPPQSWEYAPIIGMFSDPGFYVCYARWFPGWMSAPHVYPVDRHSIGVSGAWNIGASTRIDLASTQPVTAGQYAIRRAGAPHYDGALPDATEPAVFILFGNGPAIPTLVDPNQAIYVRV